ncbi:MAG: hypothetical protein SH818_05740 [Saprospiraceae bacterium]|nr:hypothetical protein [Saprospiraceae bacterium]
MKKRTSNLLLILLLLSSMLVFFYINFCPSVTETGVLASDNLIDVSRDMVLLPEFEMVSDAIKAVIDFIRP